MNNWKKRRSKSGRSCLSYPEELAQIRRFERKNGDERSLRQRLMALAQSRLEEQQLQLEAFALLKELILRKTGLRLFDSQLIAALELARGKLVELPTGEGKTIAAVLPAALAALQGRRIHVLVYNDYLAQRDFAFTREIYEFCGLTVGVLQECTPLEERKNRYRCDVLYATAKEVGFDLLRDFLCQEKEAQCNPPLDYAIIDEADSILIDEAAIPLVIAGNTDSRANQAVQVERAVKALSAAGVTVNRAEHQAYLTDQGIAELEQRLCVPNLYDGRQEALLAMIHAALEAEFLLVRDKDYLVREREIRLIDPLTGRVAPNRRFPDQLHRAVEAKEQLSATEEGKIYNSICMQAFLAQYQKLCGMSGTLQTAEKELHHLYGLEVAVVAPHTPCIRRDWEDRLFVSDEARDQAIVARIRCAKEKGQPVLIGTQSVLESERISSLLQQEQIEHVVLNAKQDQWEAELIARAGEPGRITISTNMAGRGVDIRLGGSDARAQEQVRKSGGLLVLGVGINRSRRIDNQLRGRAGRQGDPGEACFYISLQDPLLEQYGLAKPAAAEALEKQTQKRFQRAIRRVQKYAEGEDAEARYMLGRYSYLLEQQRKILAARKQQLLEGKQDAAFLEELEKGCYSHQVDSAGVKGVEKAWRQLMLYHSTQCWAEYLSAMEAVRDGIHLVVIGGKNPLDEYHRIAIASFQEMLDDLKEKVQEGLQSHLITENGIDLRQAGLCGATTTWTYLIDESVSQFGKKSQLWQALERRFASISKK